jgi:hypothetical protein
MDMDLKDYDCRTALHVAAAEGEITGAKDQYLMSA